MSTNIGKMKIRIQVNRVTPQGVNVDVVAEDSTGQVLDRWKDVTLAIGDSLDVVLDAIVQFKNQRVM